MKLRALLFDLDGTLINSRDDLADSVNLTLARMKLDTLSPASVAGFVGEGVFNLLNRAVSASLQKDAGIELANRGVDIFREIYFENCLVKTKLYDGVAETLEVLSGFEKAVVTNKPYDFSVKILDGLKIAKHFSFVVGGDTFSERKPSAMPLLKTCEKLGIQPEECLMIGDSRVDIEAGKNAGMKTCGCTFGFRPRAELETADFLIEEFAQINELSIFNSQLNS